MDLARTTSIFRSKSIKKEVYTSYRLIISENLSPSLIRNHKNFFEIWSSFRLFDLIMDGKSTNDFPVASSLDLPTPHSAGATKNVKKASPKGGLKLMNLALA